MTPSEMVFWMSLFLLSPASSAMGIGQRMTSSGTSPGSTLSLL